MLISILAFNFSLNSTGQETTFSTINQEKRDNLVQILTCDFNGLGYSSDIFSNDPIQESEPDEIEFRTSPACVDSGDDVNGEMVRLYADNSNLVSSTTNPDDFYLYREDKNGTTRYLVTHFELIYYRKNVVTNGWDEINDPSSLLSQREIKIKVETIIESVEPIRTLNNGVEIYHTTAWNREFIPNIMNHPWN